MCEFLVILYNHGIVIRYVEATDKANAEHKAVAAIFGISYEDAQELICTESMDIVVFDSWPRESEYP